MDLDCYTIMWFLMKLITLKDVAPSIWNNQRGIHTWDRIADLFWLYCHKNKRKIQWEHFELMHEHPNKDKDTLKYTVQSISHDSFILLLSPV